MDPRRGERHTWMKTYLKVRFFLFPVKFQKKNNKVETCLFSFFHWAVKEKKGKKCTQLFYRLKKTQDHILVRPIGLEREQIKAFRKQKCL